MARIAARAAAVQMVYESMMGGEGGEETLHGLIGLEPEAVDQAFIDEILAGVQEKQDDLDAKIGQNLKDWSLDRISRVSLAVLRVAVYELDYMGDLPAAVVVNEAVTLAKRFDTPQAGKFVNGVLSSVLRMDGQEAETAPDEAQ